MARSIGPPEPLSPARVAHAASGSTIVIESRRERTVHRLAEHGLTAEYPIAYQIGAGILAHSYIVNIKGYLFESPVTWFRASGWDTSPGYGRARALDFDRPINDTCLFCHAGSVRFSDADGRKPVSTALTGITCDRCHGPGDAHVRSPSAKNIVNPAKLPNRARDSVCEQCHLEGSARVLNPEKTWRDFQPGMDLQTVAAVYVLERNGREVQPVSQTEQLANSKCALASGGRLWCGSCHKVHEGHTGQDHAFRQVCVSCHPTVSKTAHPNTQSECTGCHMPRVSTEYAHVAITDHRILRRPAQRAEEPRQTPATLGAWIDPPDEFRQRDLAVAELTAGHRLGIPSIRSGGLHRLETLTPVQRDNAAVLAAACQAALDEGMLNQAIQFCRGARRVEPESADRAMLLGMVLAKARMLPEAEHEFQEAIRLDPSLKHAYVELWSLYESQGQQAGMAQTADRFLAWNPSNIMFRVLKNEDSTPKP